MVEASSSADIEHRWTWRRLLRVAAAADLVVMVVTGLVLRDTEALAFSGFILLGILFLRIRGGLAGVAMLGVLSADAALFMLPAATSNAAHREDLLSIMVPASLGVISLAGAAASIGSIWRRHPSSGGRVAALIPQAAIAVFAVSLIAAVVQQRGEASSAPKAGDVAVKIRNVAFQPTTLTVPAGAITFAIENTDLFWHTFTIDDVLNVDTPVGGRRRATVTLRPGSYEFYCRVPGHRAAGMKGTISVT